jgi:hypothetical protein
LYQILVVPGKKVKRVTPGQKLQNIMETLGITDPKTVDLTRKTGSDAIYGFRVPP